MCESSVFASQTSNGIGHGAGHSPLRGYLGLFLTLRVTLNCKNVEFRKSEWNLCGQIIQCCVYVQWACFLQLFGAPRGPYPNDCLCPLVCPVAYIFIGSLLPTPIWRGRRPACARFWWALRGRRRYCELLRAPHFGEPTARRPLPSNPPCRCDTSTR